MKIIVKTTRQDAKDYLESLVLNYQGQLNAYSEELLHKYMAKGYEEKELNFQIEVSCDRFSLNKCSCTIKVVVVTPHLSDYKTHFSVKDCDYVSETYLKSTNELGSILRKTIQYEYQKEQAAIATQQLAALNLLVKNQPCSMPFLWGNYTYEAKFEADSIGLPIESKTFSFDQVVSETVKSIENTIGISPELKELAVSELERRRKAIEQQKEQEIQAQLAKKEALKQWALANGSELLKLRIEENMNWVQLADDEYFTSILPEGFEYMESPNDSWDVKNASLDQIKELRAIRIATNNDSAKLERYKYVDEDGEVTHVDVVSVKFESISGSKRLFEKVISRSHDLIEE